MSAISTIEMYNILKKKLGDNEAKALTEYVELQVERTFEREKDILSTKDDLFKIEVKLSDVKSEIIKWMFIFWIGQIAVTLAMIYFKS